MTNTDNGLVLEDAFQAPDYGEMADRLRTVGRDILEQGQRQGAEDLIEKAKRILCLADQIRSENGG